jgi:hypothetical protein
MGCAYYLRMSMFSGGRGWLIFGLPPAEAAVHPLDGNFSQRHAGHEMIDALGGSLGRQDRHRLKPYLWRPSSR